MRLSRLFCVLLWIVLILPQSVLGQATSPTDRAMALFDEYAPTIEEEEGPITYKRAVEGDLNGDGKTDVLIEFGIGAEGGNATLRKQVAIYLNTDQGVEVAGGFEPDYCPSIDRIEGGTVVINELDACAPPRPETVATHRYVFDDGTLTTAQSRSSGEGRTEIEVRNLSENELPTEVAFAGEFVQAKQWRDDKGTNVYVAYRREGEQTKYEVNNLELFAKQVSISGEKKVVWDIYDFVRDCGNLDHSLGLEEDATSVTDLDADGVAETTLVYTKFCGGGLSAADLKVLMMEGDEKYGLRGKRFVPLPSADSVDLDTFAFNLSEVKGAETEEGTTTHQSKKDGRYKNEEDFATAPPAFLEYARKKWKEHVRP